MTATSPLCFPARTLLALAAAALLAPGWLPGASPTPLAAQGLTAAQEARIDSIFDRWSDPGAPGVSVAVTRNGETVLSRGYGSAQLEYGIPVSPATVFHVASVSKQFTTFAIALLERDGLLSWDDDVRVHLPELPDLGASFTLRHLANHTSGVRDQWELLAMAGWRLDDVITREQILSLMSRQRELNFEPGSEYLYSNMGYTLLAEVVERVSGQGFGEFLEDRVFGPLGMDRTHVHSDHTMIVPNRAYSYRPLPEGGWQKAVLSYANQGATSLFTTAEDLALWIREMEEPRVGDREMWAEMSRPAALTNGETVSYALGLSVADFRGLETVGHGGADAGFRSAVLHFPEERVGIVVLGNGANFNSGGTARAVAEVLLEDRLAPPPEIQASQSGAGNGEASEPSRPGHGELAQYQGTYYSPELDTFYRIRLEEDDLILGHVRQPDRPLAPRGDDRFEGSSWPMRILEFQRGEDGEIQGFRATGGRVRNLLFLRVGEPAPR